MSLESWMEEFYPISAEELVSETTNDLDLVAHSLRKWEGALPENLEKHGAIYISHRLFDEGDNKILDFDASSCTLCKIYNKNFFCTILRAGTELECPIIRVQGKPCDEECNGVNVYSESEHNPRAMVSLLKRTLTFVKYGA